MTDTRQHTTIAVIAAGLALAAILPAKAQDTPGDGPRTVVVEREYDPEIGDADKIDLLPPAERKSAPATEAEYALTARPYTGKMELNTLGTGYSPTPPGKAGQGMAYAGYGSGGTADAGLYINPHRFNDNEIYVKALFSGVNSDRKPYTSGGNAGNAAEWHARHYSTDIAAGYKHSFELLDFYMAGSFGLDNFNLRPTLGPEPMDDRGRHTKGRVKAGIRSEAGRLGYDVALTYSYFDKAYGRAFLPGMNSENRFSAAASVTYRPGKRSALHAAAVVDNYSYTNAAVPGFTAVGINPAYTFDRGGLKVRLGLHLDFASHARDKVRVAPDIDLRYTFAKSYTLFVTAHGGTPDNGYRALEAINPWWNPAFARDGSVRLADRYDQLDIDFGLSAAPAGGLRLTLGGGYDIDKGDICLIGGEAEAWHSPYIETGQRTTRAINGRIGISYTLDDVLALDASATVLRWDDSGDAMLALKPRYVIGAGIDWRITRGLHLAAGYKGIGRNDNRVAGRIDDLWAKVSYTFYRGLGIYARMSNIIGSDNCLGYAYPSAGRAFVGGVAYEF